MFKAKMTIISLNLFQNLKRYSTFENVSINVIFQHYFPTVFYMEPEPCRFYAYLSKELLLTRLKQRSAWCHHTSQD